MHILLTDLLTCPRCGPGFGLILLADRMDDRRVEAGWLGCANCREQFRIEAGTVDLRSGPHAPVAGPLAEGGEERALRMAALLGLADGAGAVLVTGADRDLVGRVAALLPNATVVDGATSESHDRGPDGADRVLLGASLPFRSGSLRGVVLAGPAASGDLAEVARVLARDGRVVLDPAPANVADRVGPAGLQLLLHQEGVAVASGSAPG